MAGFMWLGHGGPYHKTVCWHSDGSGRQVTVQANGQTYSAAAVTASGLSNNVAITVNGLSPDTEYPFSVFEDGVLVYTSNGSRDNDVEYPHLRTHPLIGTAFSVAWTSCIQLQSGSPVMIRMRKDASILAVIMYGDTPYADDPGATWWGLTWTTITVDPSFANWSKTFEAWHRNYLVQRLLRGVELIRGWNDHEIMDNGSPDDAFYVSNLATARSVMAAWSVGNPANTDPGIDVGALYFRWVAGPIEHFVLDTQSYKSAISATDNASKTLYGATQKQWLKDYAAASAAGFKAIGSGYRLGTALTDHADGPKSYQTEEAELLTYFEAVACSYWHEGDFHAVSVTHKANPWKLGICPCPGGVGVFHSHGAGYSGDVVAKGAGYLGNTVGLSHAYGVQRISADWQSVTIEIQMMNKRSNSPWWRGTVDAGVNALRYGQLHVG